MLQVRYHSNFKGGPTLLFAGSSGDLESLIAFFREWDGREVSLLERLKGSGETYVNGVRELLVLGTSDSAGRLAWTRDVGRWTVARSAIPRIVDLLEGLTQAKSPGHQYLDSGSDEIQIICSKDEYPVPSAAST